MSFARVVWQDDDKERSTIICDDDPFIDARKPKEILRIDILDPVTAGVPAEFLPLFA